MEQEVVNGALVVKISSLVNQQRSAKTNHETAHSVGFVAEKYPIGKLINRHCWQQNY